MEQSSAKTMILKRPLIPDLLDLKGANENVNYTVVDSQDTLKNF